MGKVEKCVKLILTFGVIVVTSNALENPGICAIVFVMPNSVPENGPAKSLWEK